MSFPRLLVYRWLQVIAVLLMGMPLSAQHAVTITVEQLPATHQAEPIFIAGAFNKWQPDLPAYQLRKDGWGIAYSIELTNVPAGDLQFKFTRGSWQKVSCAADGNDQPNYMVPITGDTTVVVKIDGWKDDFEPIATAPVHTASPNVHLLDEFFEVPQLQRSRAVWVYLPPGYENSKSRYPVLYMQDGQNLFDAATAFAGEWGVDETIDSLSAKGIQPCIVVGIYNGGNLRMSEYNPWPFTYKHAGDSQHWEGEGEQYVSFLNESLKPYIDRHFRTLAGKENTIIAGSSMGGLVALYAALQYPDVFGKAGIFSPAFWTAPPLADLVDAKASRMSGKYFFYMGAREGEQHISLMEQIQEKIGSLSTGMIYSATDPQGQHNEAAWRKWFVEFYKWIVADGYNIVTNHSD